MPHRTPPPSSGLLKCHTLSIDQLKALWDSYDGAVTTDPEIDGEDVHLELNLRGEREYCSI